jgi:hypothetical protein
MTTHDEQGMTYGRMLALAARYMGDETINDDGDIVPPSDLESLARAQRVVRRSLNNIVARNRDWSWLRQDVTITWDTTGNGPQNVEGDKTRYIMPWYFNGISDQYWRFVSSSGPSRVIDVVPMSKLNYQLSQDGTSTRTGNPFWCGFRKLRETSGAETHKWEAVFYPQPNSNYTIKITVQADPGNMAGLASRFIAGPTYDDVVEDAIAYHARRDDRL